MEKMKLIEEEELAQLLLDSAELHALEEGGVDNWEGYDYSFSEYCDNGKYYRELSDMTTKEIVKNYKDA